MTRRVSYPKWLKLSLAVIVVSALALNAAFSLPLKAARDLSPFVTDRSGHWVAGFTVEDGIWRIPADLDEIDPRFVNYLIAIEDERFYRHSGVDLPAIARAGRSWVRAGKPVSGASTLTMQLVRQIEPRPRTFRSKVIESFRAVQYEVFLSKREIAELYLSRVSYGGNIEGVHAASLIYFGKPPYQLTDAEIALLIALPQAPEARRPDVRPETARKGRDKILDKLVRAGALTDLQGLEAKAEAVTSIKHNVPETAWITAYGLSNKDVESSLLDLSLQHKVEAITAQFAANIPDETNTAIIVVENATMAVRAHVASADRERPGGWIDMTDRARSPGSTLKPFIYGLAMDDGSLSSGSFIADAPTRFGSYQPENFNRRYHGQVRIYEALRHSLNVPAVAALDQVGGHRFEETLASSGVDVQRLGDKSEQAGLALALGGLGITVNDLAVLYAGLANGGEVQALRWQESDKSEPFQLLSRDVASDLTQVLRQAPTPDGRVPAWLAENAPPIAYKTGTSYGFRDAWAAGYTDDWTIIVWVGRPDGAPRPGETGRLSAAPLLFDVFAALPHEAGDMAYLKDHDAPVGLGRVKDTTETAPQILFPPDKSELLATKLGPDARGFALSARVRDGDTRYFVDGKPVPRERGHAIWYPDSPGFYTVTAVDDLGRTASSHVEVVTRMN